MVVVAVVAMLETLDVIHSIDNCQLERVQLVVIFERVGQANGSCSWDDSSTSSKV
jgi:hypothetical protein